MASFYSQESSGSGAGGFYNGGGYAGGDQFQQFQQPPQQQQQQQNAQPQFQQSQQQQSSFSNVNQWQAPSQAPSQQSNMQQQSQQHQQQPQNFWNPSSSMAMAGLAAQAMSGGMTTQQAFDNVINIVPVPPNWTPRSIVPGLDATMIALRAYFAVDNRYVQLKMKKVLFPFLSKQWRRMVCIQLLLIVPTFHEIINRVLSLKSIHSSFSLTVARRRTRNDQLCATQLG